MGRSSGARPPKAVREEVAQLKARLGECDSSEWQKAQAIFDDIVELCRVVGPSRGKMAPRACKLCGRYGHTRQFCPHSDRELREYERWKEANPPLREEDCDAEQWAHVSQCRAITARVEEGRRLGLGCTREVECASEIDLECACSGCVEWRAWMEQKGPS